MANFKDHLKAEIFSETFSRIFFSGTAGRIVAVVFAITYALVSLVAAIVRTLFGILSAILAKMVSTYLGSQFRKRRKALRELKRKAKKFGDSLAIRRGSQWTAYEISGTGFRRGDFSLALAFHPKTGATRFFLIDNEGQRELDHAEIRPYFTSRSGFPTLENFATVYANLRTHVL